MMRVILLIAIITALPLQAQNSTSKDKQFEEAWNKYISMLEARIKANDAKLRELEAARFDSMESAMEREREHLQKAMERFAKTLPSAAKGDKLKTAIGAIRGLKNMQDANKELEKANEAWDTTAEERKLDAENRELQKNIDLSRQYLKITLSNTSSTGQTVGSGVTVASEFAARANSSATATADKRSAAREEAAKRAREEAAKQARGGSSGGGGESGERRVGGDVRGGGERGGGGQSGGGNNSGGNSGSGRGGDVSAGEGSVVTRDTKTGRETSRQGIEGTTVKGERKKD